MSKGHYKIYGEQTGKIASAVYLLESLVHEICDNLNASDITKEKISYAKIGISQYNEIKTSLDRKISEMEVDWL